MEECICGMYSKPEQVPGQVDYQCGTIIVDDFPNFPQFGKDCLMRQVSRLSGILGESNAQLAQQADLLRRALEVVQGFMEEAECLTTGLEPPVIGLSENCDCKVCGLAHEAQALLADLKALEVK